MQGGGYGDPFQRDPKYVAIDVRKGLVSVGGAESYGVVMNQDLTVNSPATQALRGENRRHRSIISKDYLFDRGGSIEEIKARSLEETGLAPPEAPRESMLYGPIRG